MENLGSWLQLIISLATLGGIVIAIYKFSRDPDIEASTKIEILRNTCELRKEHYDKTAEETKNNIRDIKNNHLRHIENDVASIKGDIKSIFIALKIRDK